MEIILALFIGVICIPCLIALFSRKRQQSPNISCRDVTPQPPQKPIQVTVTRENPIKEDEEIEEEEELVISVSCTIEID